MKDIELVTLSKSAKCNLIRAAVEEPSKETDLYLIGKRWGSRIIVFSSSTIQTSIRHPTGVYIGNYNALERLKKLERVWNPENSPFKTGYVGGAHSHVLPNRLDKLSEEELKNISREMASLEKERWIEIILKLHQRDYVLDREVGEEIFAKGKNLIARIYDEGFHAYHFVFSAYHIGADGKVKPVTLRLDTRKF